MKELNRRLKVTLYKLLRYEFWPWWTFFLPLIPMYVLTVIVCRRLLYFTTVNPKIDMGGFFGEHKMDIMRLLPSRVVPAECLITEGDNPMLGMAQENIDFPCFVKPDVGERGWEVREIHNAEELVEYATKGFDFLIQEKLEYAMEFGLSFHKLDGQEAKVTSLCLKEFMHVTGDGDSTVEQLLAKHPRHFVYRHVVAKEYPEVLSVIPSAGENYQVHNIGNHCKGTRFVNSNEHINPEVNKSIDRVVQEIEGVDYGRLDIKVDSYKDLEEGNFKVFELNGVSGEPGHMYDRSHIFWAYADLYKEWWYILKISRQNIKKGVKTTPLTKFINQISAHFLT